VQSDEKELAAEVQEQSATLKQLHKDQARMRPLSIYLSIYI
jgi:hypothetical protein